VDQKAPQIITWVIAIILTTSITWTVVQHDVPVAATVAIATSLLLSVKQGADALARGITAARKSGAKQ
jgi:uncharacterized membrane protein (DUF4010 family)